MSYVLARHRSENVLHRGRSRSLFPALLLITACVTAVGVTVGSCHSGRAAVTAGAAADETDMTLLDAGVLVADNFTSYPRAT